MCWVPILTLSEHLKGSHIRLLTVHENLNITFKTQKVKFDKIRKSAMEMELMRAITRYAVS